MRKEYDFSRGVRSKYARHFAAGSRVVVLDPDVARVFPDAKSVNQVLRALTVIVRRQRRTAVVIDLRDRALARRRRREPRESLAQVKARLRPRRRQPVRG
jgi:hypothetical protein